MKCDFCEKDAVEECKKCGHKVCEEHQCLKCIECKSCIRHDDAGLSRCGDCYTAYGHIHIWS
jgi:hypothetical protein